MFLTPYVFAGLRFRDISRLWTGAGEITDDQGNLVSRAQIILAENEENEQLDACRWLFDEQFTPKRINQILTQISYSKLIFGKSVHEIEWEKAKDGPYAGKIVIKNFRDVDPTLFTFNPSGYPNGLYLRRPDALRSNQYTLEKVDPRRFLVVTNLPLYDDKNGIPEIEALKETEPRRAQAEKDWGRGVQRAGRGHIIGKYSKFLRGNSHQTDRDDFQDALEEMSSDTVTMLDEENQVEVLEASLQNDAFHDFVEELKMQISLVLTGSPTTLKEGKFGNQSMAESTEVRQESNLEIGDCAAISQAFTEQVLVPFCDYNWLTTDPYPFMQIIAPEMAAPTTPETQKTQTEIMDDADEIPAGDQPKPPPEKEDPVKNSKQTLTALKFQEEGELSPPVAVPAGNKHFPDEDPIPGIYSGVVDYAKEMLEEMPVKDYADVTAGEAANVFTVKRLRHFTTDVLPVLNALKMVIVETLDADTEAQAWAEYYSAAVGIFKANGIEMVPALRDDLNISFRQARQNALSDGVIRQAQEDPSVVGLRIINRDNVEHHAVHTFWDGIGIPKNHQELERGGRLRTPMDFGCVCYYEPIRNQAELTAESDWPIVFPGDTYKYYAPQSEVE